MPVEWDVVVTAYETERKPLAIRNTGYARHFAHPGFKVIPLHH